MTMLLFDTNIVSYQFKNDSRITLYASVLTHQPLALSIITVAELLKWATIHQWGKKQRQLLENTIDTYAILPLSRATCYHWAKLHYECRLKGHIIHDHDAWIAATALQYDIPLVTHNAKDFQGIEGLVVITFS